MLEQRLATSTAECDRLAHECALLIHERDEYKSRAEWLAQQLERLKYEVKTPREHVDPRQIQLVFEPFAQALLGAGSKLAADSSSSGDGEKKGKKNRKVTPHGRRVLPENLPIESIIIKPSPLPESAVEIALEVTWRLGYRRGGYYRLRIVRPIYAVSKDEAATSSHVEAVLIDSAASTAPREENATSVPPPSSTVDPARSPALGEGDAGPAPIASPTVESARLTAPREGDATAAPAASAMVESASSPAPGEGDADLAPIASPKVGAAPSTAPPDGDATSTPTTSAMVDRIVQAASSTAVNGDGDAQDTTILYAPAPDEMIPRGLPTVDLLAHVLVSKFADKLPFNRQEGITTREGVPITRGTMCGWAAHANKLARLVVDAMETDARLYADVIATDATGVLVQANEKCKHGHFWVYVADRDHVIFRYTATASNDEPKTFFKGFHGTVLSDASNVYDILFGLPDSPAEANCWSHARRYFYKAIESENRDEALIGVGFCNELFALEREFKGLPPAKRLEMRKQRAGPVIESLKRWKDEQLASLRVADGSRLLKALKYLTNQWDALCTFLKDGRVPIDNNMSERQLRSLVVGRANWLFVGSDDTAEWTCTFVSLVASCQLHGIDPEGYLRDLFRVLPVWPQNRMLELAPKFWRETRALLDDAQMALPLGPLSVPPARQLRRGGAPPAQE